MPDLELARQLVDYVDATTPPVDARTSDERSDERNTMMLEPEVPPSRRGTWMLVAASIVVVAAVSVVALVAARDDGGSQTDDDAVPTIDSAERERRAVETVTEFFAAYGRGGADTAVAMLDRASTDEVRQSEIVRWWSTIAATGDTIAEWPTSPCAVVSTGDVDPIVVECPISIEDPVAVELGLSDLMWTADAFDNGIVRRRVEPRTADFSNLTPVWRAYANYLSEFHPDEFATECDAADERPLAAADGIVLSQACAELAESVGDDVVHLRWANEYWQAIVDGDRDTAVAFGDSSITIPSHLSPFGWASTLKGQFDWWAAVDWEWTLNACRPLSNDEVECDVTGQNAWSRALGVEPVPGTYLLRLGMDGITFVQDQGFWGRWRAEVFEKFESWVKDNHPDDAVVMWQRTGTVAEALELFEINTQRFVAAQQDG